MADALLNILIYVYFTSIQKTPEKIGGLVLKCKNIKRTSLRKVRYFKI